MTGWISFFMPEDMVYKRAIFTIENHSGETQWRGGFMPSPPMDDYQYKLLIEILDSFAPLGVEKAYTPTQAQAVITKVLKQWLATRNDPTLRQAYKQSHKLC